MSEKIKLAFCVHSHQPVGNYPAVFEQGARECYLPFLRLLKEYPGIRMTLHYTGPLLEWFEDNCPEFKELLTILVSRSQVELMGGAFYEPIIPVIPEQDARKQIEYTKLYLKNKFGFVSRGIWCAERIWDPSLPKKIQGGTAVEYTLLDDSHFLSAGLCPEDVHGYYMTEREGFPLKVFPIDMQLRYLIPFKEPHEIINYLRHLKGRGVKVITYGDDGEKFGMWPGTHKWVLEQGWLRRFFDGMLQVSNEIEIIPLSEALDTYAPTGLTYLPTATYQEMMEWSLIAPQGRYYEDLVKRAKEEHDWDRRRGFLRGGMWDNFLSKYPESNLMHKKMLKVSNLVHAHGDDPLALKHLFMAQCNCSYWHGLFGGIYIGALRHAVYENLLKAEQIIDAKQLSGRSWIMEQSDHDMDGRKEILISGRILNCYISPHVNASVFALEYKPKQYNLSNILMRHPEIYHKDVMNPKPRKKDEGEHLSIHDIAHESPEEFKNLLIYDTYPRNSFITHYLKTPASVEKIIKENRIESSLIPHLPFNLVNDIKSDAGIELTFSGVQGDLEILKTYRYDANGLISLSHEVKPMDGDAWIVLEWNIFILTNAKPLVDSQTMEGDRGVFRARGVQFHDEWKGVQVSIRSDAFWVVCVVPIECVSQSEEGFEKSLQGWSIYFMQQCHDKVPDIIFTVK